MAEDLVSIIVPVYNTEKYLDTCIESIVFQGYENLEIILINDGSTDSSEEKCNVWEKRDNRITVIHQTNKGVSAARNVGIDRSKGKWIAFVDSDDFIEKDYVEKLLYLNKRWRTGISCCQSNVSGRYIGNNEQCMESRRFLTSRSYRTTLWYYLYEKRLFNGIIFPEGKLSEDVAVLYKLIYKAERIAITSDVLYHHTIREGSLSNSRYRITKCDLDRIDILKEKAIFFEQREERELAETAWRDYLTNLLIVYGYRNNNVLKINKSELIRKYRKYLGKLWKNRSVPWKLKIILFVSYIIPDIGGQLLR